MKGIKLDCYRYNPWETPNCINEHYLIGLRINKTRQEGELDGLGQKEISNVGSASILPAQVEQEEIYIDNRFLSYLLLSNAPRVESAETVRLESQSLRELLAQQSDDLDKEARWMLL